MSDVAAAVLRWRQRGLPVTVARVVDTSGFSSRERAALAAFAPGEPVVGSLLAGAVDGQIHAHAATRADQRSLLDVQISDLAATGAGLSCGGTARLLLQPASDIDDAGWTALADGSPVCLITELPAGDSEIATAETIDGAESRHPGVRRIFGRGASQTVLLEAPDSVTMVTSLWPVPALIVVGTGLIADALAAAADLLEWTTSIVGTAGEAARAIAGLTHADAVVVLSHDREVDGPALRAALASGAGYVGGLGSARTQSARAAWLAEQGLAAATVARIHGPAGLDIGAFTPAEIAIAITAEIVAARSGASGGSLRGRSGPIRGS